MRPHFHIFVKDPDESCVIHKRKRCFSTHADAILKAVRKAAGEGGPVSAERLRKLAGLEEMTDKAFESELMKMHCWPPACHTQIEAVGIMNRGLDAERARHPNLTPVRSDDLPTIEGLHFNTAGILELGRRLAAASGDKGASGAPDPAGGRP
jgi:hypothetical protein